MSTSAVNSSFLGGSGTSSTSSSTSASSTNEFLTLFIAELKNQDPSNAVDTSELTSQLATFTQVEQSVQTNLYLDTLSQYASSVNNAAAASCIGKNVAVDTSNVTVSDGTAGKITFDLSGAAANSTITIKDSSGNTVNTIKKSNLSSGVNSVSWDGKNSSGKTVDDGTYTISVSATDSAGKSVTANTSFTSKATGVLYSGGTAYLVTADGNVPYSNVTAIYSA